jgi:hypothetical protein
MGDPLLKELAETNRFWSYADDITITCKENDINNIVETLDQRLRLFGMDLSKPKCNYIGG